MGDGCVLVSGAAWAGFGRTTRGPTGSCEGGSAFSFPAGFLVALLCSVPWLVAQDAAVFKPALGSFQWAASPVEVFAEAFPSSVGVGSLLGLGQGGQLLLLMRGGGSRLQGAQGTFGGNVVVSSANAAHSALVGVIWGWSEDCC